MTAISTRPDSGVSAPRPSARFLGLDQARALAIIAMMVFHFGPGLFTRVPALEPLRTPVLWFGRTATPAFATVFGLTAGFVLLPRYLAGASPQTSHRLRRRAGLILLCAVIVTVPLWIHLAVRDVTEFWPWAFGLYSVLLFYSLAFLVLPIWLRFLGRQTVARAVLAGTGLWLVGTAGYYLWPKGPLSAPEFVRMMLLSGNYGYLQMMGTALLAIPLGWGLRRAVDSRTEERFLVTLLGLGVALAILGAGWGRAVGEYDFGRIVAGDLRVPARAWYFLHFGALALVAMVVAELLTRRVRSFRTPGYVLALFGQTSLLLYTGHAFVMPALEWSNRFAGLGGPWRVAIPLLAFAAFCALVLYRQHRRVQGPRPVSAEPPTAPRPTPRLALRVLVPSFRD